MGLINATGFIGLKSANLLIKKYFLFEKCGGKLKENGIIKFLLLKISISIECKENKISGLRQATPPHGDRSRLWMV